MTDWLSARRSAILGYLVTIGCVLNAILVVGYLLTGEWRQAIQPAAGIGVLVCVRQGYLATERAIDAWAERKIREIEER